MWIVRLALRRPYTFDVFVRQQVDYPTVMVNVDRLRADEVGLTQKDVDSSLLISLSSSGQVAPNQWLNPQNGVNYQIAVQTPQVKVDTFEAMKRTPITTLGGTSGRKRLLDNLATLERITSATIESHYDVQPARTRRLKPAPTVCPLTVPWGKAHTPQRAIVRTPARSCLPRSNLCTLEAERIRRLMMRIKTILCPIDLGPESPIMRRVSRGYTAQRCIFCT
jgi:hypothetical protein